MDEASLQEYLEFAKALSQEASAIMLKYFRADNLATNWKQDNSPVTIADEEINNLVIAKVKQQYPEHGVLGEENSFKSERAAVWVVDPIDGTSAYNLGMPNSTFCLSLVVDGEVQVAVVHDPFLKRLVTATKNGGTYANNKRVTVSADGNFQHKYIFAPAGSEDDKELFLPIQAKLRSMAAKIIVIPSFSYMALFITEGKMLAAYMSYGSPWDAAAISLIVEEAGGVSTDFMGNKRKLNEWGDGLLVSNGEVHNQMLEMIKDARSGN